METIPCIYCGFECVFRFEEGSWAAEGSSGGRLWKTSTFSAGKLLSLLTRLITNDVSHHWLCLFCLFPFDMSVLCSHSGSSGHAHLSEPMSEGQSQTFWRCFEEEHRWTDSCEFKSRQTENNFNSSTEVNHYWHLGAGQIRGVSGPEVDSRPRVWNPYFRESNGAVFTILFFGQSTLFQNVDLKNKIVPCYSSLFLKQEALAPYKHIEKDLKSLKEIVEMKNQQIHHQEQKISDLEKVVGTNRPSVSNRLHYG